MARRLRSDKSNRLGFTKKHTGEKRGGRISRPSSERESQRESSSAANAAYGSSDETTRHRRRNGAVM